MTGFGRGELDTKLGFVSIEVKSVNSKTCSIVVRLPETLLSLESNISSYVKKRVSRGQINISVAFNKDSSAFGSDVIIDHELAQKYCQQLTKMREFLSLDDSIGLSSIVSLPGVINIEEPRISPDEVWSAAHSVLEVAVDQLISAREREGLAIQADLSQRLKIMAELIEQINDRSHEAVEKYRERIHKRIEELLRDEVSLDESRIAVEVAIMAERCDITEEIVRLRSHLSQIRDNLGNSEEPIGRRLDFILQEVNREVNTIASKASNTKISTYCIQFKDETEKMREQVQNIE